MPPVRTAAAFLLAALLAVLRTSARPLPEDFTRKDVKNHGLHQSGTYDPARSTWKAETIEVAGKGQIIHKASSADSQWFFDGATAQADMPRYRRMSEVNIADGKLSFTTQKNGELW